MYPRIPWKLFADPLWSSERSLRTTALVHWLNDCIEAQCVFYAVEAELLNTVKLASVSIGR